MKKMKNWFMNTPWAPFVAGPLVVLLIFLVAKFISPLVLLIFPIALVCFVSGLFFYIVRDIIRNEFFK